MHSCCMGCWKGLSVLPAHAGNRPNLGSPTRGVNANITKVAREAPAGFWFHGTRRTAASFRLLGTIRRNGSHWVLQGTGPW